MKITVITISIIAVIGTAIYFGAKAFFKAYNVNYDQKTITYSIDNSKDIKLDFDGCQLKVEGWGKDYVEVTPNEFVQDSYKLQQDGNTIVFDYESYKRNYEKTAFIGFTVMVPRHTKVSVTTDNLRIRDCSIRSINADSVSR